MGGNARRAEGCVNGRTRILMADYSWRRVNELAAAANGVEAIGMDKHGRIGGTRLLRVKKGAARTTSWVRVTVERRGIGRGSSFGAVVVHPPAESLDALPSGC